MYIYTYIHIYIDTYIYIHTYMHTYIHMHTYMNAYIHTYSQTNIHIHTTYIHTHIYIHTFIHMYMHAYIHTEIMVNRRRVLGQYTHPLMATGTIPIKGMKMRRIKNVTRPVFVTPVTRHIARAHSSSSALTQRERPAHRSPIEQLKHSITTFLQQAFDDLRAELAQQLQNSSSFWATLPDPHFRSPTLPPGALVWADLQECLSRGTQVEL
jgi:hypothetical protein